MKEVTIDGAKITTKEELHATLAAGLGFPDYYGGNLDALADCLGDCDTARITLLHTQALSAVLGLRYVTILIRIVTRAAEENDGITALIFPQDRCDGIH